MSGSRSIRSIITILMNLLIVVAVLDTIRIVVEFFGALASQTWGLAAIRVTDLAVVPFGVEAIKTPYGGAFDVDAALTVGALLLAEWVLSALRGRV
jgi:uncharacterized membrane protein YccF (DUF307 family)